MAIRICVAGATGWTGGLVVKHILKSKDFKIVAAIARQSFGKDIGEVLGVERAGVDICQSLDEALTQPFDVLIDYTKPDSVKARTMTALDRGLRVVIGTSGLTSADFDEIQEKAERQGLGVIAAGNFSVTAALAKHFALIAAQHLPSWEIIDYAHAEKIDTPSGTVRELAEKLAEVRKNHVSLPIEKVMGERNARGGAIAGTQVHSIRLPSYVIAFETIFGLPNERLTIRHDAGSGADPYVTGTLLAAQKVMGVTGLVRGLDTLLFGQGNL